MMLDNNFNNMDHEQISGVFNSYQNLNSLMNELNANGISDKNINILMADNTRQSYTHNAGDNINEGVNDAIENSRMPEGTSTGAISGGLLGALIGGLTLVGSVALPGAGLLAAGPIVGALTGGAIGAASGGVIGALIGAGIPENEAQEYEKALQQQGNVVVIAHIHRNQSSQIRSIFERYGAKQIKAN